MSDAQRASRSLRRRIGVESPPGDWFVVTQERIDRFADVTLDDQFIHTDPGRAEATSFGSTIAHGLLTLSLIRPLLATSPSEPLPSDGLTMEVNYGFDRVRFIEPVLTGSRIRAASAITDVERRELAVQVIQRVTVEIESCDRPALIADWIGWLVYES